MIVIERGRESVIIWTAHGVVRPLLWDNNKVTSQNFSVVRSRTCLYSFVSTLREAVLGGEEGGTGELLFAKVVRRWETDSERRSANHKNMGNRCCGGWQE